MKFNEAKKLIETEVPEYADKDEWALWLPFEDFHDLQANIPPLEWNEDGRTLRGVEMRGDEMVSGAQILPKNVDMFEVGRVLEDPPLGLVEELVDVEVEEEDELEMPGRLTTVHTSFYYDVVAVEYRFSLPKVEHAMSLRQMQEVVNWASSEPEPTVSVSPDSELVVRKDMSDNAASTSVPVFIDVNVDEFGELSLGDVLYHMGVERQLAEVGIEQIGASQRYDLTERVQRLVDDESPAPPVIESTGDPDTCGLADPMDFETEEEEITIGEKVVLLGGMHMNLPGSD